ncbi:uncharacterized protein LOC9657619 [Selaginella moellendorffii]|nr:uncharacterized protein LOC9657619 [Selaginella moellendorffii]|eukprot:XP_002980854.2 uncharacterized protein LOC9657619 [Selaginella moellendorffii]
MARVSASKARAFTRNDSAAAASISRLWSKAALLTMTVLVSWAVVAIRAPPPKICGAPGGPPVTAPRIKLRDGRYLAYKEAGVPKDQAKHKIVILHGYTRCRLALISASPDTIERLGVYMVSYDRAGYGQSDPHPARSVESEARDVEELADSLGLGSKFYVLSVSLGAHGAWGCIKYIPQRLAGVALVVPVVNYFWPSVSTPEGRAVFNKQPLGDRLFLSVSHYAPWLVYWWLTQKILPTSSTVNMNQADICPSDRAAQEETRESDAQERKEALQQGLSESLCRDSSVMFGKWPFDPAELENPFEGENLTKKIIHVWQGEKDFLVPVELQRMVVKKLESWVEYHEIPERGHILREFTDQILETLVS